MHEFYEIVHANNILRKECWCMTNGIMSVPDGAEYVCLYFADGSKLHFNVTGHKLMSAGDGPTRWWHLLSPTDHYNPKLLERISQSEHHRKVHSNISEGLFKMLYDMMLYKLKRQSDSDNNARGEAYCLIRNYFLNEHNLHVHRERWWVQKVLDEGWERTDGVFGKKRIF